MENEDCKSEQKVGQNGTSWEKWRSKSFSGNFATIEEEDVQLII